MKTKVKKTIKVITAGIFCMGFLFSAKGNLENPLIEMDEQVPVQPTSGESNPWKVVWEWCVPKNEYLIKCRLEGGESCYANWQVPCTC